MAIRFSINLGLKTCYRMSFHFSHLFLLVGGSILHYYLQPEELNAQNVASATAEGKKRIYINNCEKSKNWKPEIVTMWLMNRVLSANTKSRAVRTPTMIPNEAHVASAAPKLESSTTAKWFLMDFPFTYCELSSQTDDFFAFKLKAAMKRCISLTYLMYRSK